jgi:hypothetical protein
VLLLNTDCLQQVDLILVFNATFSNISAISWRPVLVVKEDPERTNDHEQATGKLYHLWLRVECTFLFYSSSPCQRQRELLASVVCHPLTFHILIFSSETPQPN